MEDAGTWDASVDCNLGEVACAEGHKGLHLGQRSREAWGDSQGGSYVVLEEHKDSLWEGSRHLKAIGDEDQDNK